MYFHPFLYDFIDTQNNFFGPNGSEMSGIDMSNSNCASSTQFDKTQAHENQPMKRFRDISEIFKFVKVAHREY